MNPKRSIIINIVITISLLTATYAVYIYKRNSLKLEQSTVNPTSRPPFHSFIDPGGLIALLIPTMPGPTPAPLTASMHEIIGTVTSRKPDQSDFTAVTPDQILTVSSTVKTAEQSRVRLDLSNQTIVRLGENTIFVFKDERKGVDGGRYFLDLGLGEIWIILKGGEVNVETPSGLAAVRGSFLHVTYRPENNLTTISCLEGHCELENEGGRAELVSGETALVYSPSIPPVTGRMTGAEASDWVLNNPEATLVIPILEATFAALPTITPGPSNTPPGIFGPTQTANTASPTSTNSTFTTTNTYTPGATGTFTPTFTSTFTRTITTTPSRTPTAKAASTRTLTPVYTPTKTQTSVLTSTRTYTPIPSATKTLTPVPTSTKSQTPTSTSTATFTPIPTFTKTSTPSITFTATSTPTITLTPTITPVSGCAGVTEIPVIECNALVALYNSTNGNGWTNKTGWLVTNTPCTWYRVTCINGHVTHIFVANNNLVGSIPAELGNIQSLIQLGLGSNKLSSNIPPQLGNLTNLQELRIETNLLSGSIPTELGKLTNLKLLYLFENQFSGNIPTELGNLTNLLQLALYNNRLSGNIPPTLGGLSNLNYINLGINQLNGSIPLELGNLINLSSLSLARNQLSGSIPSQLGNLINMQQLQLYENVLTGTIPVELGNLRNLKYLGLYGNQLTGNIPTEFGNLNNLVWLQLEFTSLAGPIPTGIKNALLMERFTFPTSVCVPNDSGFITWINALLTHSAYALCP